MHHVCHKRPALTDVLLIDQGTPCERVFHEICRNSGLQVRLRATRDLVDAVRLIAQQPPQWIIINTNACAETQRQIFELFAELAPTSRMVAIADRGNGMVRGLRTVRRDRLAGLCQEVARAEARVR